MEGKEVYILSDSESSQVSVVEDVIDLNWNFDMSTCSPKPQKRHTSEYIPFKSSPDFLDFNKSLQSKVSNLSSRFSMLKLNINSNVTLSRTNTSQLDISNCYSSQLGREPMTTTFAHTIHTTQFNQLRQQCWRTPEFKACKSQKCDVPAIEADCLRQVLEKEPESVVLIDCRWPYEHAGGSIIGAYSCYDALELLENFKSQDFPAENKKIIFFCEFSQVRGRKMSSFFTKYVQRNEMHGYDDIYLLTGGYKNFQQTGKTFLTTGKHITENDQRFEIEQRFFSQNRSYKMNIPADYL
ncbi:Rhodanese-like domain-containing protein [Spironucleus salmonicida]|uniref:Rhodanese-like domain-containing protein n=1 Tax=Spironucleus salmonicida TaxID=348837 RepID=V6M091_9EUKA|nr:Rhodanese-like domain-containing protein [Spironucleus salmonicida]|eukprot:EST49456.1 Rhodanese-like domain-containing protein [Spironucleus salmonicida]